jgi:hypothetical protein
VPPESTTRLGDWCANLLHAGRRQLVLAISSRTFFPVLVEAAPIGMLPARIRNAAGAGLRSLGIPAELIEGELDQMGDVVWAKSASRRATGILVDFAKALPFYLEDGSSLDAVSAKLSDKPIISGSPTALFPDQATAALFGVDRGSVHRLTTRDAGGTVIT